MELMYVLDDTVGSSRRINATVLAYIAGFLDGDGCIKSKVEHRECARFGSYIKVVVTFSQHLRDRHVLEWIHNQLRIGSISDYDKPSKHLSEYQITDGKFIERLLKNLDRYVVNKKEQLRLALIILSLKDRAKNENSFKTAIWAANRMHELNSSCSPVTTDMGGTR